MCRRLVRVARPDVALDVGLVDTAAHAHGAGAGAGHLAGLAGPGLGGGGAGLSEQVRARGAVCVYGGGAGCVYACAPSVRKGRHRAAGLSRCRVELGGLCHGCCSVATCACVTVVWASEPAALTIALASTFTAAAAHSRPRRRGYGDPTQPPAAGRCGVCPTATPARPPRFTPATTRSTHTPAAARTRTTWLTPGRRACAGGRRGWTARAETAAPGRRTMKSIRTQTTTTTTTGAEEAVERGQGQAAVTTTMPEAPAAAGGLGRRAGTTRLRRSSSRPLRSRRPRGGRVWSVEPPPRRRWGRAGRGGEDGLGVWGGGGGGEWQGAGTGAGQGVGEGQGHSRAGLGWVHAVMRRLLL